MSESSKIEADLGSQLELMIEGGDWRGAARCLEALEPAAAARALARLADSEQGRLLDGLDPAAAARVLGKLPEAQAAGLLEGIEPQAAASIVGGLPSAEQADLLTALGEREAESILEQMLPSDADRIRALASYSHDVAGGLMVTEYLAYPETAAIDDVLGDLRRGADRYRDYTVQYSYVVDALGRLVGVLRMRDLLLAPPGARVSTLMIRDPLTVRDSTPLDELRAFFRAHAFFGVPVVDSDRRFVGLVRREDVGEALAERSESEFLKSQGIVAGEELRTMPALRRARRRLGWLSINIALNIAAASVIALHQDTLSAVIALAVFLPIISDMSGCAGNQAVAVTMRELALGLARPGDLFRIWGQEIGVGLLNGVALGLLIGAVAWIWKGNLYLGLVVGLAMALNTAVAVTIGGTVPLLLRRFGKDPALASGPILTTITDMCGFFLVLSIAAAMLERLA